jgi:hypothetical protein
MAAEATDEKYAIPVRCSPSDRKMFDEDAMLILTFYVPE